jgi:hypothetical protein
MVVAIVAWFDGAVCVKIMVASIFNSIKSKLNLNIVLSKKTAWVLEKLISFIDDFRLGKNHVLNKFFNNKELKTWKTNLQQDPSPVIQAEPNIIL